MTAEERAYNYASTQKPTKLQVGEIAKHYNNGYDQAVQDFLEKAEKFFNEELFTRFSGKEYRVSSNKCMNLQQFIEQFKNYMQDEEM